MENFETNDFLKNFIIFVIAFEFTMGLREKLPSWFQQPTKLTRTPVLSYYQLIHVRVPHL
jgi:hypothetical protein